MHPVAVETTHIVGEDGRPYCGSKQHPLIHGGLNVSNCDTCIRMAASDAGISRCAGCGFFHDEKTAWWFHGPGAKERRP